MIFKGTFFSIVLVFSLTIVWGLGKRGGLLCGLVVVVECLCSLDNGLGRLNAQIEARGYNNQGLRLVQSRAFVCFSLII